jgi:hypothetical protein
MPKKYWWKNAALLTAGTLLSLELAGGCLSSAVLQRALVAVLFD